MSKITFRADDELVERVERLDASKSEVMREALRAYLGESDGNVEAAAPTDPEAKSLDDVVAERVDELVERRLGDATGGGSGVDVHVSIEPESGGRVSHATAADGREGERGRAKSDRAPSGDVADEGPDGHGAVGRTEQEPTDGTRTCAQCGESLSGDHVYCPNCGQKATQRVFCECGDEVRSDWAFCPHCGRRTASAGVLET